jgi:hypothetical protein
MVKFVTISCLLLSFFSNSQKIPENIRCYKKNSAGSQFGGPTLFVSAYYNRFLTQNVNLEVGAGLLGLYGGPRLYYGKKDRTTPVSPYIGFQLCYTSIMKVSSSYGGTGFSGWEQKLGLYAPLGIQFLSKRGFCLSVELAFMKYPSNTVRNTWGAIRIGQNF